MITEALSIILSSGAALGGLVTAIAAWRSTRGKNSTVNVKVSGPDGERTVTITGASQEQIAALLRTLEKESVDDSPDATAPRGDEPVEPSRSSDADSG